MLNGGVWMGGREGVGAENSLFLSRSHSSYGAHLLNLTNPPTVTQSESGQRGKRKRTVSFGADKRPEKCYGPSISPPLSPCLPACLGPVVHVVRTVSGIVRHFGVWGTDHQTDSSAFPSQPIFWLFYRMNSTERVIAVFMEV